MANTGGLSALTKAQLVDLLTTAGEVPNPQWNKTEVHSRLKTVIDGLIKTPPTWGMANMTLGQLRTRAKDLGLEFALKHQRADLMMLIRQMHEKCKATRGSENTVSFGKYKAQEVWLGVAP